MKKPFMPEMLPVKLNDADIIEIYKLEANARAKIERFNSLLERSVIKEEVLMFFSLDESIQSSRIEGTQATFSDVMEAQATGKKDKDIQEVLNYLHALQEGVRLLKSIPISTRMFLRLHEIIMEDARGQHRSPGEYRRIQNFIGPTTKIEDASYIPPEPQMVGELMSNLERYANDEFEDDFGPIARAAIIHAQFETIHPFLDGNGRVGRILIMLYLLHKGILYSPTFFVSEELEKNKFKYYALLNSIRGKEPKWKEWLVFFINSSVNQADKYIGKLVAIEALYDELMNFAKSNKINDSAVLAIFKKPFFTVKDLESEIGVSYNTARSYVAKLLTSGKIYGDDKKRNTMYRFYDLIDILR
ncbi:MAG: Fic family protein [Peptoclostridium sp.]|uniref:Fic family protein n=1 Tax=Peptoclostridium sp. TaxID=1904860 RepID=UPI00139ACC11|nr:Fic family protein [Peptoclostridium sp.]MZQ75219.1 Fic family protein [Peptoclostridium sp.]